MKNLNNPFYIYCFSFLLGLAVYNLGWSYLFPKLTINLVLFILITILIFAVFGMMYSNIKEFKNYNSVSRLKYDYLIFAFICVGFSLEFLHFGGIPFILLLVKLNVNYHDFGIPTFHVFLITLAHFYLGYAFARFKDSQRRIYLIMTAIILINDILIVSRGMFIFGIFIISFIQINYFEKLKTIHILALTLIIYLFSLGFGLLGQYRSASGNEKYVYQIFGANKTFYNANISSAYLWMYIYIASPLANLQKTINENPLIQNDFKGLFINEMVNEVVSKRVDYTKGSVTHNYRIAPYLTVGSIYFAPYNRMGWFGMTSIFLFLLIYIIVYRLLLIRFSRFDLTGIAILNSLILLCLFDNMFKEAFAITLVFPVFFDILSKIKINPTEKIKPIES
jgi:hypothetical protein